MGCTQCHVNTLRKNQQRRIIYCCPGFKMIIWLMTKNMRSDIQSQLWPAGQHAGLLPWSAPPPGDKQQAMEKEVAYSGGVIYGLNCVSPRHGQQPCPEVSISFIQLRSYEKESARILAVTLQDNWNLPRLYSYTS